MTAQSFTYQVGPTAYGVHLGGLCAVADPKARLQTHMLLLLLEPLECAETHPVA